MIEAAGIEPGENDGNAIYWMIHVAALAGVLAVRPALEPEQTFVAAPGRQAAAARRGAGPPRPPLPARPTARRRPTTSPTGGR